MRQWMVVMICGLASTASAKPLLQGDYEVVKFKSPKGELDLRKAILTDDTVWGRTRISFDGDHVTIESTNLDLTNGVYTACQAELTFDVQWNAKGFSVPAKVSSKGTQWTFKKLTPEANDDHENHCGVSMEKETYIVKGGASPTLTNKQGSMILVPLDEVKIVWTKHVRS